MKAGRELDLLIAEKVMGLREIRKKKRERISDFMNDNPTGSYDVWVYAPGKPSIFEWLDIPSYSTDIAAAWEVVEKLSMFKGCVLYGYGDSWRVLHAHYIPMHVEGGGESAPYAICVAALKMVGYELN